MLVLDGVLVLAPSTLYMVTGLGLVCDVALTPITFE